jgi:hypothetical protein
VSAGAIFNAEEQLTPGKWYALGIENLEGRIEWGGARLARYDGEGCWSDEDGEVAEIWDAMLQAWIPPGAADQFAEQS